ncbi:hypothetical protein [Serratia sp. 22264]|uniref:hypothetical protein n=1 Tax=Serratia sp. 22264 TaxID=3453897 RepID=UPI003F857E5A
MLDADLGKLPGFCSGVRCGMLLLWFERKNSYARRGVRLASEGILIENPFEFFPSIPEKNDMCLIILTCFHMLSWVCFNRFFVLNV